MAEKSGLSLKDVSGFPPDAIVKLSVYWITTAQELVSAAVREDGLSSLAEILEVSIDQVTEWVDLAQNALPPDVSFDTGDVQSFGLGALEEPPGSEPSEPPQLSFAPLPPKIDLIDRMPIIQNQGQRGTCVSFACTAVREYLLGSGPTYRDLSEQYLYWTCKQNDLIPGAGTYISVGMDRLVKDGQCQEEIWPYNPNPISGNEGQNPPPPGASSQASQFRITSTKRLPSQSVETLRQALADGEPIAFGVPVYTYWFTEPLRRTGDIRMPLPKDKMEGGHAMVLVGYEDDPATPGGGYFMVRNSWGTGWAFQSGLSAGYARIPYAYIQQYCNAAHTAQAAVIPDPDPVEDKPEDFFAKLMRFLRRLFGGS